MLLESLDALGSRGRGVAVIGPARTSKSMLDFYAARGVCGLRLNLYSLRATAAAGWRATSPRSPPSRERWAGTSK